MKWLGQHIVDLIARFRSDVYLEDVSTGTIASGGNLGLDSNNKVVKATASSGGISHDGSTANGVLTFKDADEATVEANFTFDGTDALISSTGKLNFRDANSYINSPTANDLEVVATDIVLDASGAINFELGDAEFLDFKNGTNTFARFFAESGANTILSLFELGGDSQNDLCSIIVAEHGGTKITTTDDGGTAAHFEIEADGNITLDAAGDIALEAAGNDVTIDSDTRTVTSSPADYPQLKLLNTTDDDQASQLIFDKLRADDGVATGQNLGEIWFNGQDGSQNTENYAYIISEIDVSTHGQESGKLTLGVASHDGTNQPGVILTGGSVSQEVDATIGRGAASVTTVSGTLTMGSTATINNSGVIQVAAQTVIDHDQLANFAANEHFTQANITTVGTIGTGVWQGTSIGIAYTDAKVTDLAAGEGIDISATTGSVRIDGEDATTSNKGMASFSSDNFTVSSGAVSIKDEGIDLTAKVTGVLPVANTAAKVTSIVAGDGIDVSGATGDVTVTAETASDSNPGVVELATTGEADTGTDTARAVTPAGLKSHVDLRYSYAYMTWSASAKPTRDGSNNPEWMLPHIAKGIYEEDWNADSGITSTSVGTTTYAMARSHAVNALVIPHTGILVGFHAHGRNDDSDLTFKAGLFHAEGSTTGTTNNGGIDYGNTGATNEFTLRCVATADEAEASGGADGSSGNSFKGPCKLVSNTANLAISAGDALLPAIMGNSSNSTDEIFITMTIILKIPLTT